MACGADKAYVSAMVWDEEGLACTLSAMKKETLMMLDKIRLKTEKTAFSVKAWPRTEHLKQAAEAHMAANRLERPAWMDDPFVAKSRARWARFLLEHNVTRIKVPLIGLADLQERKYLSVNEDPSVPVDKVSVAALRKALTERDVDLKQMPSTDRKACQLRLHEMQVESLRVPYKDVDTAYIGKIPAVRRAFYELMLDSYRDMGRDFRKAFSYPRWIHPDPTDPTLELPELFNPDEAHSIKNMRMSNAHRYLEYKRRERERGERTRAAGNGGGGGEAEGAPEEEEEPTQETADGGADAEMEIERALDDAQMGNAADYERAADGAGDGAGDGDGDGSGGGGGGRGGGRRQRRDPPGGLALEIAIAAQAVIDDQEGGMQEKQDEQSFTPTGQRLLHPRTLDPAFAPQHVPTARALYSLPVAARMIELGYEETGRKLQTIANWDATGYDWRGPNPRARWEAWTAMDELLDSLDETLSWQSIAPPTSLHISGYSRVAVEGIKMANESSRQEDIMVGGELAHLIYDRRKGSDVRRLPYLSLAASSACA